ncbi:MAG: uroporphyrinogen decarboxylase family protein [Anaerolineae bacterium]
MVSLPCPEVEGNLQSVALVHAVIESGWTGRPMWVGELPHAARTAIEQADRTPWRDTLSRITRNRRHLTDLFAGPFPGHAIIMNPEPIPAPHIGDYSVSDRPLSDWAAWVEHKVEAQMHSLEVLDDDSVPYADLSTNTGVFAAAFGCPIHFYEDSPACARPLVTTAEEADKLPVPSLQAPTLERVFAFAHLVTERLGPEIPISVPDIQSAFDIAALIWRKEDLFVALLENPDAVLRLADKCQTLLKDFWRTYLREFPHANLCHCPKAWAPPDLGVWLSEDEAGSLSTRAFETFCLPYLVDLSANFGGLFVHCCATADHQYSSLKKIPNLRGLNRVFQSAGPRPAIEAFSGRTVLMVAWTDEPDVHKLLDMVLPDTRLLINMQGMPLDEAKCCYDRLRARCPRTIS